MLVVRNGSLVATGELGVGSNRGTERFHTTGTLVLSNALATAASLRLAKTSMTNGTTVGRCYGRIELQQGGRICANTLQNDEGYSEFVFNGGAYMPAGGGSGTFGMKLACYCLTEKELKGQCLLIYARNLNLRFVV